MLTSKMWTLRKRGNGSRPEDSHHRDWVAKATEVFERAARGDLEARLLRASAAPQDIQRLALAVNNLLDRTDAFVREAGASLECASHGKFFRRVLERGLLGSFRRGATLINRATEKMSHQAKVLRESETRRQALAESLERAIRESAKMAQIAVEQTQQGNVVIARLNEATARIAGVVKLISEIAFKTNLLALNATIEAAHAGDAGQGFGIVASEVKALANQTASAAGKVTEDIENIQHTAEETATAILTISQTITRMNDVTQEIASSIDAS
jgi:methyl-accepting chemotaxis protein